MRRASESQAHLLTGTHTLEGVVHVDQNKVNQRVGGVRLPLHHVTSICSQPSKSSSQTVIR